nr:nucleoside 2-deoxyribosyltransferase [Pseudomonas sp. RIT-PI-S]
MAGFDVFRSDAFERGVQLKALCAAHGLEGLYPLDNALPAALEGEPAARWIYQQNVGLIRRSDALLANLNPFRGAEPDSGTVFEVGMAVALGKPVWAWFDPAGDLRTQIPHDATGRDAQGLAVEDFGLARNLMLACAWHGYSTTAEQGVAALAAYLEAAK